VVPDCAVPVTVIDDVFQTTSSRGPVIVGVCTTGGGVGVAVAVAVAVGVAVGVASSTGAGAGAGSAIAGEGSEGANTGADVPALTTTF
jgi:hypothetical protein